MFLPYHEDAVFSALSEVVKNLQPLLVSLEGMRECGFLHELSCIISDPG